MRYRVVGRAGLDDDKVSAVARAQMAEASCVKMLPSCREIAAVECPWEASSTIFALWTAR